MFDKKIVKKTRESHIEKKVTEYAKRQKWLVYKWVSPSQKWVPDRLYFKEGEVKLIEFKALGKTPTRGQSMVHKMLRKAGFEVDVVDNIEQGVLLFAPSVE